MKKLSFILLSSAFIASLMMSCKSEPKEAQLTTSRDSLSYAFGVNVAQSVKQEKLDSLINSDLFIQGFNAVLSNNNPAMTSEQAMKVIQSYFMAQQAKEMEKSKNESEKFLADNAKKEGVQTLPSGLQYKVISEGKGEKAKANSKVKVNYTGKLVNGNVFDSSKPNEPVTFNLGKNEIIAGWEEGIQLMSVGSKYEFYIPYQLAYGEKGYLGVIPPYATLIFEIELVGIEK
ncbi:MAG TPA: FKBP-type peptidyl-prolyl cis-trans isomerase [Bacteroidales bacterium]|nr:FKBP-type peptidyl-prolyl cis-trans isomerase [Bacteroidales bacterium]